MNANKNRILLLTSNPKDLPFLDVGEHISLIQKILYDTTGMFDVQYFPARQSNIQGVLQNFRPHYVHFVGHGCDEGLWLEDENQNSTLLSNEAIGSLFGGLKTTKCVLLISCYTASVSNVIGNYVEYVVGMKEKIYPTTGNRFSEGFYSSLVKGETIEKSFEIGLTNVQVSNLQDDAPLLRRIKNRNKYLLRFSEKTFSTFQLDQKSTLSFQEHIRRFVANGIKTEEKIHPDNIHISDISFDKKTLTALLPFAALTRENLSDSFIDVEILEAHDSGALAKYVKRISELKDVHTNFHEQLRIVHTLLLYTDDLAKNASANKHDPDSVWRILGEVRDNLQTYENKLDILITIAKKKLSFELTSLMLDSNNNPTDGPKWAVEILILSNEIKNLFEQIYNEPVGKKINNNYYVKIKTLRDDVQRLSKACNIWLFEIDKQIKDNAIELMSELME